jgi:cell division protein FtsB
MQQLQELIAMTLGRLQNFAEALAAFWAELDPLLLIVIVGALVFIQLTRILTQLRQHRRSRSDLVDRLDRLDVRVHALADEIADLQGYVGVRFSQNQQKRSVKA